MTVCKLVRIRTREFPKTNLGFVSALRRLVVCVHSINARGGSGGIAPLLLKPDTIWMLGYTVALLVETLWYKPESSEFDSRWGH